MNSIFLQKELGEKINNDLLLHLHYYILQKYEILIEFDKENNLKSLPNRKILIEKLKSDFPLDNLDKITEKILNDRIDFVYAIKLIFLMNSNNFDKKEINKLKRYENKMFEALSNELILFRNYIFHNSESENDEELTQRFFQTTLLFFRYLEYPKYRIPKSFYLKKDLLSRCKFWLEENAFDDRKFNFNNFEFVKKSKEIDFYEDDLSEIDDKMILKTFYKPVKFIINYKFKEKFNKFRITDEVYSSYYSKSEKKEKSNKKETSVKKETSIKPCEFSLISDQSKNV